MDGFQKIDKGLKIYYEHLGRHDYDNDSKIGKFLEYCNENELDIDDIEDELSVEDASDCIYVEFDDNFPFETEINDEQKKHEVILEIIKQCYNNGRPNIEPNIEPKKLSVLQDEIRRWVIQLTKDEYKHYKDMCTKQCSVMASLKNTKNDQTFWYGLCIGLKNNFSFLQYLTWIYMRDNIENSLENDTKNEDSDNDETENEDTGTDEDMDADYLSDWIDKYKDYFFNMNNSNQTIIIPIIDHDVDFKPQTSITISEFVHSAINSYLYRSSPPLMLPTPLGLIQDEIQQIADCIAAVSNFSQPNLWDTLQCPFQFDFVIGLNEVDSQDEKTAIKDCIGDISSNLKINDCEYCIDQRSELIYTPQRINSAFMEFKAKLNKKYKSIDPKYMNNYPQKRRFIAFLDLRKNICQLNDDNDVEEISNKKMGSLIFFEPPMDVRDFPTYKQYPNMINVPEWYFESIQKCLIPGQEYPAQPSMSPQDKRYNLLRTKNALTACNGKLLTFSFQVEEKNAVRCYMWWRGGCLFFLPQDITDLLPKIFANEDDFVFDGYDVCSWRDEKFERIYQNVTTKNPVECLRKYNK